MDFDQNLLTNEGTALFFVTKGTPNSISSDQNLGKNTGTILLFVNKMRFHVVKSSSLHVMMNTIAKKDCFIV